MPGKQEFRTRGISAKVISLATLILGVMAASPVPADSKAQFVVFDPPGSIDTVPLSINAAGDIVGYYFFDENTIDTRGFVRTADGTITSIDLGSNQTFVRGINKRGYSTGYYCSGNVCDAFVRDPDGTITTFTAGSRAYISSAYGINNHGAVAGCGARRRASWGFVRTRGGKLSSFDVIEGKKAATCALGINDSGTAIGTYFDRAESHEDGFVRSADGSITTYSVPGATYTISYSINSAGTIAGIYEGDKVYHSFLRSVDGSILEFDPPNAVQSSANGINKHGSIAGCYSDNNNISHGYMRTKAGKFVTFDPEGSTSTCASSINDSGVIIGSFGDTDNLYHGYLRLP